MQGRQQLFILGTLIFLGVSQTGCGVISRLTGVSLPTSSTRGIADTGTGTRAGVSISPLANGTNTTEQPSTNQTDTPTQPVSPYPSFGLDSSGPEVLALNERLAELGYLPVAVDGDQQPTITLSNLDSPPQDSFHWRFGNVPPELSSQWSPETYTQMTRAAVIAVEHANGLPIDGIAGQAVWKAILGPSALKNPNPYTYVLVTENPAPEKLRVWQEGKWVYQSIANTGVSGAPSTDGTFAVYERFLSQTMKGTNPNGTKYVDPGVPYVNYYDGSEAIHGFSRASYGFSQSVGCVELPVSNAKVVWSLLDYGTLVTVEGSYTSPSPTPAQTNKQGNGQGTRSTTTTSRTGNATDNGTSPSSQSNGNSTSQKTGSGTGNNTNNTTTYTGSNTPGKSEGNTSSNNTTSNTTDNAVNNTANVTSTPIGNTIGTSSA
ncbi:L,D-transpeptidase family protein [Alicyclobacillus dauci]|uniref:L,D-transpeptidase family protein n=1 Tax=Alicyclobacillus dauci TaxID=1475485 RepID=A0ABY6YYS4_9BACL|nr:L,D-transpeptidase family protein [Alicyclobacillus dauci]WAH35234.1 L,D-transpeptidase family protein [Alicyclobacillus dauci]